MERQASPRHAVEGAFVVFGYGLGTLLAIGGLISFGLQLVVLPIGLGLISLAALRHQPHVAGAVLGALLGVTAASMLSYSVGLAETIFIPNPLVLVGCIAIFGLLGYLAGRLIERPS